MKKILFLFLLLPLFVACSSDDDEKEPEGEKIAVTENDILGGWEYIDKKGDNEIRYYLYFNTNDINSHYIIYHNGVESRHRRFNYTIDGLKMKLEGGAIVGDNPMSDTEIYKRGDKLYFNNMPFTPYIE